MPLSETLAQQLPYLRRYARALAGSQTSGDSAVHLMLEAATTDSAFKAKLSDGRAALYEAFTKVWNTINSHESDRTPPSDAHELAAGMRLAAITPTSRQALLLTALEGFSMTEAAQIIGVSEEEATTLIKEAVAEIDRETTTRVLIIEDEPLISMQLEDLVSSLGHDVCGTAATRTQAQEAVAEQAPGLVLADIQLADGSSGLDAVDDILKISSVPVIFITAYPERLLTGDRPEPTYLITKPFKEQTVRAAISQALFFNSTQPLD